jgi:hypothetical protein
MLRKALLFLAVPLVVLAILAEAPMAFGKTLILASEFEGRLVDADGNPAAGVEVVRTWEWAWTSDTGSDSAQTDGDGRFSFGVVTGSSFSARLVPHQPVIHQEITANGPSGPVLLFSVDKQNYDPDSELFGRGLTLTKLNFVCRIDQEPGDTGAFWGTCMPADQAN